MRKSKIHLEKQLLQNINLKRVSNHSCVQHLKMNYITHKWNAFKKVANLPRSGHPSTFIIISNHGMLRGIQKLQRATSQTLQASLSILNCKPMTAQLCEDNCGLFVLEGSFCHLYIWKISMRPFCSQKIFAVALLSINLKLEYSRHKHEAIFFFLNNCLHIYLWLMNSSGKLFHVRYT